MKTNQFQTETSSTTTGTSTTGKTTCSGWNITYSTPQQGWECPRCGRINAPWMSQCCCGRGYWYPTWTSDHVYVGDKPEWWKEVTCHDDNIMNNPTTYQVGGSDYWNPKTATWSNVASSDSSNANPNTTTYAYNKVPYTFTTSEPINCGHVEYNPKEK